MKNGNFSRVLFGFNIGIIDTENIFLFENKFFFHILIYCKFMQLQFYWEFVIITIDFFVNLSSMAFV